MVSQVKLSPLMSEQFGFLFFLNIELKRLIVLEYFNFCFIKERYCKFESFLLFLTDYFFCRTDCLAELALIMFWISVTFIMLIACCVPQRPEKKGVGLV